MVGLFFGSFNPIHNGHLTIARYLLKYRYCEEVWFVVSPQNPWKKDQTLLEEEKRLQIVQSAIAEDSRMKASDVEFYMPRPSYTSQTLHLLKRCRLSPPIIREKPVSGNRRFNNCKGWAV